MLAAMNAIGQTDRFYFQADLSYLHSFHNEYGKAARAGELAVEHSHELAPLVFRNLAEAYANLGNLSKAAYYLRQSIEWGCFADSGNFMYDFQQYPHEAQTSLDTFKRFFQRREAALIENPLLATFIDSLYERDQRVRKPIDTARVREVDIANIAAVGAILKSGALTIRSVGMNRMGHLTMILHHNYDLLGYWEVLPSLERAVHAGKLPNYLMVKFTDMWEGMRGDSVTYGGTYITYLRSHPPLRDPANADQRRASIFLMPLALDAECKEYRGAANYVPDSLLIRKYLNALR